MTTHHNSHHFSKRLPFLFNPLELAVCGFSNAGKTTLSTSIIKQLAGDFDISYVKHGHRFELDKPGKDSFKAREAGAVNCFMAGPEMHAMIRQGKLNEYTVQKHLLDADLVIAEGWKNAPIDKILVLDSNGEALKAIQSGDFDRVIACTGEAAESPLEAPGEIPYFQRDDINGISTFVRNYLISKTISRPLYGLLLAGGKSVRMGEDKTQLDYHGRSQLDWAYEKLAAVTDDCFVSSRSDQDITETYKRIDDRFIGFGPMGGILSAMSEHCDASWLVLACDLPFLEDETLKYLIEHRNPHKYATAYKSSHDQFPEPLCAIYEPKVKHQLLHFLGLGYHCPRKVLINSDIAELEQKNPRWLDNVNHPEEYQEAKKHFND